MSHLLDTCVISELASAQPNAAVLAWLSGALEEQLYLSVITLGELKKGVDKLPDSRRRRKLEDWLATDLTARFAGRLVALDAGVLLTWGGLVARLESHGRVLPAIDSLIAASALHHKLDLVTRNVADFEGAGVRVINPWEDAIR